MALFHNFDKSSPTFDILSMPNSAVKRATKFTSPTPP